MLRVVYQPTVPYGKLQIRKVTRFEFTISYINLTI